MRQSVRDIRKIFGAPPVPVSRDVWSKSTYDDYAQDLIDASRQGRMADAAMAGAGALGSIDDRIQSAIRKNVYGQQPDGSYPNVFLGSAAEIFHQPREVYARHPQGHIGLIGSRGLQAGAVTAAGASLIDLTNQFANSFGGPADQQERGTLPM